MSPFAKSTSRVDEFTTHINNIASTIKFTMEREKNKSTSHAWYTHSQEEDGSTKITIYRKATHTDQCLVMDSLQHKLGVIRTLMHRAETLVTDEEDKLLEIEKIGKALGVCGYKRSHFAVANARNPPNRQVLGLQPPTPTGALS